uniref:leucine-rich repeat domain-containing protein n=1 Tax=Flavobacterium psychrophilum TaxID=96345 RepID=UPI00374D82CB
MTAIGGFAFEYCDTLTSVTIPNSVTTIEEYAFTSCTGLTAITIPDSVTSIEEGGFILCSALTSIILPKALTTIGKHAFQECTNLRSVTIPNSVVNCYITTPLIIDGSVFLDVRISKARLNVPVGAEIAYEAARVWNRFKTISGSLLK